MSFLSAHLVVRGHTALSLQVQQLFIDDAGGQDLAVHIDHLVVGEVGHDVYQLALRIEYLSHAYVPNVAVECFNRRLQSKCMLDLLFTFNFFDKSP